MKRTIIVFGALMLPVLAVSESQGYKKPRYGMAGCGLASIFIQENEMLPQLGKSAADWFFGLGSTNTSAMTTGTSNCTDAPASSAMLMEQQVFVSMNFNSLTKEAAQGEGEHLQAFAQLLGCDEAGFAKFVKDKHGEIFSAFEPNVALDSVKSLIKNSGGLTCERV